MPDPARALTVTTALWGSLAVGIMSLAVYRFNRRLLDSSETFKVNPLLLEIAGLAALSMAFAPLVWSQAIIIEIYSLNLLFLAGLLAPGILVGKTGQRRAAFPAGRRGRAGCRASPDGDL